MNKYTNPFYTIREATAILRSLGVKPYENAPATPDPDDPLNEKIENVHWQDHILSITVDRRYEHSVHHHIVELHMDAPGFNKLVQEISAAGTMCTIKSCRMGEDYEKHSFEPSPLLTIVTLVYKKEAPNETVAL